MNNNQRAIWDFPLRRSNVASICPRYERMNYWYSQLYLSPPPLGCSLLVMMLDNERNGFAISLKNAFPQLSASPAASCTNKSNSKPLVKNKNYSEGQEYVFLSQFEICQKSMSVQYILYNIMLQYPRCALLLLLLSHCHTQKHHI